MGYLDVSPTCKRPTPFPAGNGEHDPLASIRQPASRHAMSYRIPIYSILESNSFNMNRPIKKSMLTDIYHFSKRPQTTCSFTATRAQLRIRIQAFMPLIALPTHQRMKKADKRRNRTEIEQQRRKPHAALLGLQHTLCRP